MMRTLSIVVLAAVLCTLAGPASAELLNLGLTHYPRLYADQMHVTYTYNSADETGLLVLEADPYSYFDVFHDDTGAVDWADPGTFLLTAVIDKNGQALSGNLTVTAYDGFLGEPEDGEEDSLFVSTTLTAFGFGQEDLFEFKFLQAGPGLPDDGEEIGVIFSAYSIGLFDGVDPYFTESFSNNGNGIANAFYMPEPGTLALLATGACMLARKRKARA
jgi:hypothetical protein